MTVAALAGLQLPGTAYLFASIQATFIHPPTPTKKKALLIELSDGHGIHRLKFTALTRSTKSKCTEGEVKVVVVVVDVLVIVSYL